MVKQHPVAGPWQLLMPRPRSLAGTRPAPETVAALLGYCPVFVGAWDVPEKV